MGRSKDTQLGLRYGELIREARERKEWTQEELAKRVGTHQPQIAAYENGRYPREQRRKKFARVLRIPVSLDKHDIENPKAPSRYGSESSFDAEEDQDQSDQVRSTRIPSETEEENAEVAEQKNSSKVFTVSGPFPLPFPRGLAGHPKRLGKKERNQFLKSLPDDLKKGRGVYIFAIRNGSDTTPLYVGQAKDSSFSHECLISDKQEKYRDGLADHPPGGPVMFFIMHKPQRGGPNGEAIDQIEKKLIHVAEIKNPNLVNKNHRVNIKWPIPGIDGRNSQTKASKAFLNALGLTESAEDNSE